MLGRERLEETGRKSSVGIVRLEECGQKTLVGRGWSAVGGCVWIRGLYICINFA